MKGSAYIKNGRLLIMGVDDFEGVPVPFSYHAPAPEGIEDGPLRIEGEPSEPLAEALDAANKRIRKQVKRGALRVAAENLVLRARQGDQNAMAMLIAVRENAQEGVPRARAALRAIRRYIEDHPPTEKTVFGAETRSLMTKALSRHVSSNDPEEYVTAVLTMLPHVTTERAVNLVANGPLVDKELVKVICSELSGRNARFFQQSFFGQDEPSSQAGQLGQVFRKARGLQAARKGRFDLFCPCVAYELGM